MTKGKASDLVALEADLAVAEIDARVFATAYKTYRRRVGFKLGEREDDFTSACRRWEEHLRGDIESLTKQIAELREGESS
ncbi:MAG: hypothetical protein AAF368_00080 [Planctomycetota bacterium]